LGLHPVGDAEQTRHGEAPDVGIEHSDGETLTGQRNGEVDRHAALADATLAAGDGEDAGGQRHLGVGRVLACRPTCFGHHLTALFGRHLAPFDAHVAHERMQRDPGLDVLLDLATQRTAADGQLDPHGHVDPTGGIRGRDDDVGDHAQRDDVGTQFGVDHGTQQFEDLVAALDRPEGRAVAVGRRRSGDHA